MKDERAVLKVTKEVKKSQFVDCEVHGGVEIAGQNTKFSGTKIYGFYKNHKKFSWTAIVLFIVGLVAFLSNITNLYQFFSPEETPHISVFDVQYELADENGSVIHRRNWQDNQILDADARNITRMILSIKLRSSNNSALFAYVKNEEEISNMPYVTNLVGDFKNEHYLVPANSDTGFIFGIDMTPFTQLTLLSASTTNTQEIKIFDEDGNYLDTVQSNIVKTYGMYIPYEIDILSKDKKIIDTLEFSVRCRAVIGEMKAVLGNVEGADGKITKSLNFECIPTI